MGHSRKLTIEITNHCSLNCLHCSTRANNRGGYQMPIQTYNRILKENVSDFDTLKLSGGEPFEHNEIYLFTKIPHEIGFKKVEILSCGNYYGSSVSYDSLAKCSNYIDKIMFSIYGNPKAHNKICRAKNSRQNLGKTIEHCVDLKIPFKFETLAMQGVNLNEIFEYISHFKNLHSPPSIKLLHLIDQGRAESMTQKFNPEQTKKFVEDFNRLGQEFKISTRLSCSLEGKCLAKSGKKAIVIVEDYLREVNCSALKYSNNKSCH